MLGLRLPARAHRHQMLAGLAALSLSLHMTLFLCWLMIPSTQPPTAESEPLSVDFVVDEGPAKAAPPGPAAPMEAPAAPLAPAASSENVETPPSTPAPPAPMPLLVQESEPPPPPEPAPAPDAPVSPPVQQGVTPPPPRPAPAPDLPQPAPVEQAEMTPPAPPPAPIAAPSASPPVVQARPPWGRARDWRSAASRTNQANNGAAWMAKLEQWWDQHAARPTEAAPSEGGDVKVRMSIAADGEVTSIELVQGSGSRALDAAALAVFRNARLPPFPPDAPAQPADVVMTLRFRPSRAGG